MARSRIQTWIITLVALLDLPLIAVPGHAQVSKTLFSNPAKSHVQRIAALNDALLKAVFDNQVPQIKTLLAQGADPNGDNHEPLNEAAAFGEMKIVRLLLSRGAKINGRADSGNTALLSAAESGHTQVISYLLAHGANPNLHGEEGDTPLHGAVNSGWISAVRDLLAHGANPSAKNKKGQTPFAMAIANRGMPQIIALLAKVTPGAVFPKAPSLPPLILAIDHGDAAKAAALLASGKTSGIHGTFGGTALVHAAGDSAADYYLARHPAPILKPHSSRQVARHVKAAQAASQKHVDELEQQDQKIVLLLLAHGAPINYQDRVKDTALSKAVESGDLVNIRALLAHGANPNIQDDIGCTVLIYAVDTLSAYNPPQSASQELVEHNFREIISTLLAHEPTVNVQDEGGQTALMLAAYVRDTSVLRMLLAAGANPRMTNIRGQTALDYARNHKNLAAVRLLKQAMQKATRQTKTASKAINHGG